MALVEAAPYWYGGDPPLDAEAAAWRLGDAKPPGSLPTELFYQTLGKKVGADAEGRALGACIVKMCFAPTIAEHEENVTVKALTNALHASGLGDGESGWINSICKYLGEPGKPAVLTAGQLPVPAFQTNVPRRTNIKKIQNHRAAIGAELGLEGMDAYKARGFDLSRFSVKPSTARLKQGQVTTLQRDIRADAVTYTNGNLYADDDFIRLQSEMAEQAWPNLIVRSGKTDRNWHSVLCHAWTNGHKAGVRRH